MSEKKESKKKEKSIEENFAELDELLEKLESEELPLEDSFTLYEKGMKLLKETGEKLDRVEKKMQVLNEEGEVEDFS